MLSAFKAVVDGVPFAPGGICDLVARVVAGSLSSRLGWPVVVGKPAR